MQEQNKFKLEPKDSIDSSDIEKSLIEENDDLEDDSFLEEDESWDDGDDRDDRYGSSGEKYGWCNGFSDDAIDDAFEGDPEATWNVD